VTTKKISFHANPNTQKGYASNAISPSRLLTEYAFGYVLNARKKQDRPLIATNMSTSKPETVNVHIHVPEIVIVFKFDLSSLLPFLQLLNKNASTKKS
jgi:hypothetical protein